MEKKIRKEYGFNNWEAKGKIELPVNSAQADSIERLRKTIHGMHFANVTIRKDGKNIDFQIDWIKHILPLIEIVIADSK